jgi:hypothetical protein
MTKHVFSIFLMLAFCGYAAAADLNAPAIKKVAVDSEIERGFGAINNRCLMGGDVFNFELCASEVMDNERHGNTDTDAFYLGAYYREWLAISTRQDAIASVLAEGPDSNAEAEAPKVNRDADVYFKFYRKYQKELRVADKQLCKASHLRCDYVLPKMETYRARLEKE